MMLKVVALILCLIILGQVNSSVTRDEIIDLSAIIPTSMMLSSYILIDGPVGQPSPELYQWSHNSLILKGNFSNNKVWNVNGIAIGPEDRLLYVIANPSYDNSSQWNVYRINRTTGMLHEPCFINLNLRDGWDSNPQDIAFGYDGNIYVLSSKHVNRYHAKTGAYMDVFVSWEYNYYYPEFRGMVFSNTNGLLYVAISGSNVYAFNGTTGSSIGDIGNNVVVYIQYICQDSNGYLYIPNILNIYPRNCQDGVGGVLRYRPNIDPAPQSFIVTGNGIFPYSCQVGLGSMNQTLIVADPCNKQFRLYNLESGNLIGFANTNESPARFINWNDVASE